MKSCCRIRPFIDTCIIGASKAQGEEEEEEEKRIKKLSIQFDQNK